MVWFFSLYKLRCDTVDTGSLAAQLTCSIFSAQPTLWFALFTHRDATLWLFKDSFCLKEKTALHTVHSFWQHSRLLSLPEGFGVQNLKKSNFEFIQVIQIYRFFFLPTNKKIFQRNFHHLFWTSSRAPEGPPGSPSPCCSTLSTLSRLWPLWPPAWCPWPCSSPSPSSCGSSGGRPRGIKTANFPCPKDPWASPSSARPATGSCR